MHALYIPVVYSVSSPRLLLNFVLMSFISLNVLSTVAVVTGRTSAIVASFTRFGKPDERVSLVRRLYITLCVLGIESSPSVSVFKFAKIILLNIFHSASVCSGSTSGLECLILP